MKCLNFVEIENLISKKVPFLKRFLFNQHIKRCNECNEKYIEVLETVEFEAELNQLIDDWDD